MKGFIALVSLAALGGCAAFNATFNQSSASADKWMHWTCDSQADVFWRFADSARQAVDVRLGSGDQVYRLKPEAGAVDSGVLYSDNVLAFHKKGEEGLVYWVATNDLIGRACKAP